MKLEEAIKNLNKQLKNTKKANECGLATKGEFKEDIQAIEKVLNYIKILERATDNKYCYVVGGRTLYSRLSELKKEDLIKEYLTLRNKTNQYVKENSIPKKKIEDKIKKLGNYYGKYKFKNVIIKNRNFIKYKRFSLYHRCS